MQEARPIRMLDDHVVNKIAAGEVVDRPASVVKELLENALDAGATQVDIEVVAGGRDAIVITDNGSGMGRDDALLSLERHATSKIRDVQDIEQVATMGFRGEALAAISAVSRFTLRTCRRGDEAGTEINIAGGKILEVREAGPIPGTQMAARNLFFNTPARRKFLRSDATETAHIRQVFLLYALACPEVGLRLVIDRREVHNLPPEDSLEARLKTLYPPHLVADLRPVLLETPLVTVRGYAGLPATARGDRSEQYFFINRRPAAAPVLHYGLSEGYREALPRDRHPVVFLFLELPPETVDVNVHPTKREVRFRHPGAVRDAMIEAVRSAIGASPVSAPLSGCAPATLPLRLAPPPAVVHMESLPMGDAPSSVAPPPGGAFPAPAVAPASVEAAAGASPRVEIPAVGPPAEPARRLPEGGPWKWYRLLGQVGGQYAVLETEDGLVLMDPRAAHERVLYEHFMGQASRQKIASQGLLMPQTFSLAPRDALAVRKHIGLLRESGFGIAEFGGDAFVVDAVPAVFGELPAAAFLADVVQALDQGGGRRTAAELGRDLIAQVAARHAVRRTEAALGREALDRLIGDLAACEMPYTCPHGRPTLLHFGMGELARKFGRS